MKFPFKRVFPTAAVCAAVRHFFSLHHGHFRNEGYVPMRIGYGVVVVVYNNNQIVSFSDGWRWILLYYK